MIEITTNNEIILDGRRTGLGLAQRQYGSVVYTIENPLSGIAYAEHAMPRARYSAAHDEPASGAAGRTQLETDVRALLASQS